MRTIYINKETKDKLMHLIETHREVIDQTNKLLMQSTMDNLQEENEELGIQALFEYEEKIDKKVGKFEGNNGKSEDNGSS